MAYSKPSIGIWFSDQVLTESLGMIGEGRSCKARKPEADVYQSFVASSCIISTGTTLGDASKAYGSDSIRLLILGCRIAADPTLRRVHWQWWWLWRLQYSDSMGRTVCTLTEPNFQLKPLPLSSMGLCRHLFGDAFEKIRFPCLILVFILCVLYICFVFMMFVESPYYRKSHLDQIQMGNNINFLLLLEIMSDEVCSLMAAYI